MCEKLDLFKCNVCGNLVQVLLAGAGELVCCGEPMNKLEAKFEENSELAEKHVPKIVEENGTFVVSVEQHPMINEHYIQFIEVCSENKSKICLKYFNPNDRAEFKVSDFDSDIKAVEYCNIHGLWRSKND